MSPGGCTDCTTLELNREKFAPEDWEEGWQELCEGCPWFMEIDAIIPWLYDYLLMQEAGCPIGRWELNTAQWKLLGDFRRERDIWIKENSRKDGDERN